MPARCRSPSSLGVWPSSRRRGSIATLGLGIGVEQYLAGGALPGGRSLAAALDPLDQDHSHGEELIVVEQMVGKAPRIGACAGGCGRPPTSNRQDSQFVQDKTHILGWTRRTCPGMGMGPR